jgi:DNA-binding MarR family transcriptional regulator
MQLYKLVLALFLTVSAASAAQAADLSSWTVELQMNADKSVGWKVTLAYDDFVTRDDYWVLAKVDRYSVLADGKPVECRKAPQEVGTSIICEDFSAKTVIFDIKAQDQIGSFNAFNIFAYTFPVTRVTDKFTLIATIPLGSALVSADQLQGTGLTPFSPSFGKEGTDGRKIFVTWELQNPTLGESISSRLIFEPVVGPITEIFVLIVVAAIIILLGYVHFHRGKVKHVLPILTQSERSVMQIIMERKSVDQRDIVQETDFSKAKVSRIVKELEGRGLIETQPKGRTKLIRLRSGRREEPAEKQEKKIAKETREEEKEKQRKEARQQRIIRRLLGKE